MPLTVLVTGGAGYIGSHTIMELLEAGHSVICVDNLVNAYCEEGSKLPEALKRVQELTGKTVVYYNVDIRDIAALDKVFKQHKIDCVGHFAALKAVGESCELPLQYYQNNITGSNILLEVMRDNNVFNLLYSSSATVYGIPQFLPITEQHPTGNCTNPYGKTKYFTEEILKDVCQSDKRWHVISLRYFNPVGAHPSGRIGEDPNGIPNNLMPFVSQVAVGRREKLKVFGSDYSTPDGTGVRDYIHIVDLAQGHLHALDKLGRGDVDGFVAYNLGTGQGYSVLEIVKAFEKAANRSIPYELAPRRAGDIASAYADPTKAANELGWRAKLNLDAMCRDAWNWQSKNPSGFSKL